MTVRWIFDPAPPSGRRTGGNAAEYSFEGQIDILVREVVQNSLDAAPLDEEGRVDVRFRLVELDGDFLEAFLQGLEWSSLEDNLRAVPKGRGGRAIANGIARMEESDALRLLIIEDRGTRGLEGSERRGSDEEKNSFSALVRDELYSDKAAMDAGGSFGLGKSVLWAYSSLKTVLFASAPRERPPGKTGLRFIGRTSLPYHETEDDGACSGDGWLGVARGGDTNGRHAESVWSEEAARLAARCFCPREEGENGLSIVVVGFAEPGEEDRETTVVAEAMVEAALESFWPAIVRGTLGIQVQRERNDEILETTAADPSAHPGYRPATELLRAYDEGRLDDSSDRLDVGESGMTWVAIQVPERTEEPTHRELQGKVPVLVRVLEDTDEIQPIRDRVFRFRRPGLVVRSGGGSNLSIAARPYVAAVPAGRAGGQTEADYHVERFLRCAEPPAHDQWTHNTRLIKQEYKSWGCKKKLADFDRRVLDAIRNMVSQPEEKGGELPRYLVRHLRFGDRSGGGRPRFVSVTRTRARPHDGSWKFEARCRRIQPDDQPWHVAVHLKYSMDGGGGADVHAIGSIASDRAIRSEVRKGVGLLEFPPDVASASVRGEADPNALPAVGTRSAVRLRIDGFKGGIPDA